MTRREFLKKMLEATFGTIYIEFKKTNAGIVTYTKGGSLCKDCTYSNTYQKHIEDLYAPLFDAQYHQITIAGKPSEPIATYQKKAVAFLYKMKPFRDLKEETLDVIKTILTLQNFSAIYLDIVIKTLFDIGRQKPSKERASDDFATSLEKISEEIQKYIIKEFPLLQERHFTKLYFRKVAEEYPVFQELNLEEDNKIVEEHLKAAVIFCRNSFGEFKMSFVDAVELIESYQNEIGVLSRYADKENLIDETFFELDMTLDQLLVDVCGYHNLLSKDQVIDFKNTAVRVYNHLYGQGHSIYEGVVYLAAWSAHEKYLDYLVRLSVVLKEYDIQ